MDALTTASLARADVREPAVAALLAAHHALMRAQTPLESSHVKSGEELTACGAQVFVLRDAGGAVMSVGALQPLGDGAVELKSMHTALPYRGRGLGKRMLDALMAEARRSGARSAWLETGSEATFAAARALYEGAGFSYCEPFADYVEDPLSVFMTRTL